MLPREATQIFVPTFLLLIKLMELDLLGRQ